MENILPSKIPVNHIEMIKQILHKKMNANNHYSLRAFARDLDINPGFLSEILAGKTNISIEKARKISEKMELTDEDQKLFLKLVEISKANVEQEENLKRELYNYDSRYLNISNSHCSPISDWDSLAFLELINVVGFKNDIEWIAAKLMMPAEEVRPMIERLLVSGLIEVLDGKIKKNYDYFALPNGNNLKQARDFHHTVLAQARVALEEQASEERNFSAGFIHIKKQDIPLINEKIKKFRREVAYEFESEEGDDSVYMLAVQLFRRSNAN